MAGAMTLVWADGQTEDFFGYVSVRDGVAVVVETDGTGHAQRTRHIPLAQLREWRTRR